MEFPILQLGQSVKQHPFDSHMIVKIFEVLKLRDSARYMRVLRGRSVARKGQIVRLT